MIDLPNIGLSPAHEGAQGDAALSTRRAVGEDLAAHLPWLRPIVGAEDLNRVCYAARKDGHDPIRPTHCLELGGEIIGALSIGGIVHFEVWTHSEKMKARNSRLMLNLVENLIAAQHGGAVICLPCSERSPYKPFMEKFGYHHGGQFGLYYKKV